MVFNPQTAEIVKKISHLASASIPFLLLVDFELQHYFLSPVEDLPDDIRFATPAYRLQTGESFGYGDFYFSKHPVDYKIYSKAFNLVQRNILAGKSFLVNLCFPSVVQTDLNLEDIFFISEARYKLLYKDRFVVFSPETFVTIREGTIRSHPMKGTIDAGIANARYLLLEDKKEMAEHVTIVDLIRNDMSMHARGVKVERFRYVEELRTNCRDLLQTSSAISGTLQGDYLARLGEIIFSMLPAGSVSGAPKRETLRIIREAEQRPRGYYTGIMGYFDGKDFDSAVLIRFIEKKPEGMIYWSGGGITSMSVVTQEYQELVDKIYVPFN